MKKIIALAMVSVLCICVFCACSKKNGDKNDNSSYDVLKPTEEVNIEELVPDEDFVGDYKNDDYTAHVEKDENSEMVITVRSVVKDGTGYEWVLRGYFSDEYYRVNYTDAVKYAVSYKTDGSEKSRETVYENGAGRISFADTGHFTWSNSMETLEGSNEFAK